MGTSHRWVFLSESLASSTAISNVFSPLSSTPLSLHHEQITQGSAINCLLRNQVREKNTPRSRDHKKLFLSGGSGNGQCNESLWASGQQREGVLCLCQQLQGDKLPGQTSGGYGRSPSAHDFLNILASFIDSYLHIASKDMNFLSVSIWKDPPIPPPNGHKLHSPLELGSFLFHCLKASNAASWFDIYLFIFFLDI